MDRSAFGVAAVLLLGLWSFGRGHLSSAEASIRAKSFIWPVAATALGFAVTGDSHSLHGDAVTGRRQVTARGSEPVKWAGTLLLACETAFLIAAGRPCYRRVPSSWFRLRHVLALQRAVGSSLVGFGVGASPFTGFPQVWKSGRTSTTPLESTS